MGTFLKDLTPIERDFAKAGIAQELNKLGIRLANTGDKQKAKAKKLIHDIEGVLESAKSLFDI